VTEGAGGALFASEPPSSAKDGAMGVCLMMMTVIDHLSMQILTTKEQIKIAFKYEHSFMVKRKKRTFFQINKLVKKILI